MQPPGWGILFQSQIELTPIMVLTRFVVQALCKRSASKAWFAKVLGVRPRARRV